MKNILNRCERLKFRKSVNLKETLSDLIEYVEQVEEDKESAQKRLREYKKEEEIVRLKNELDAIRENSLAILSSKEKEKADKFSKEHYDKCGGDVSYIITYTGIGTSKSVQCSKCKKIESITDYDLW